MTTTITEHGLTGLKKSTSQKDIRALAAELGSMGRKSAWGMTDLAIHWADNSEQDMGVLAAWLGCEVESLYDRCAVGRKFPLADRDTESDFLTYSHYRALCALEERDDRIKWRDKTATERIPVNKLRSVLAGKDGIANATETPAKTPQSRKGTAGGTKRETSSQNENDGFKAPTFTPAANVAPAPMTYGHAEVSGNPLIVLPRELSDRLYQLGGDYAGALAEAVRRIESSFATPPVNRRGEFLEVRA